MNRFGLIVLCGFMLCALSANAHRMDIAWTMESGAIVFEAWMGRDEPVRQGEVTITDQNGTILVQDQTDEDGFYTWTPDVADTVIVQIYGGQGHNQRVTIPEEEVAEVIASATTASTDLTTGKTTQEATTPPTQTQRTSSGSTQDTLSTPIRVLLGLTFIFSLAATWLSYQNSKRLLAIEQKLNNPDA